MAGRPPKPLLLLELSGQTAKNPGRYANRGPEPETSGPIGDPPIEFDRDSSSIALKALWLKLVDEAPIGLLTASDREYLAKVCRVGVEAQRPGKNYLRALEIYGRMLKGLGMTPEGRAIRGMGGKAASGPQEKKSPLEAFNRRRTG